MHVSLPSASEKFYITNRRCLFTVRVPVVRDAIYALFSPLRIGMWLYYDDTRSLVYPVTRFFLSFHRKATIVANSFGGCARNLDGTRLGGLTCILLPSLKWWTKFQTSWKSNARSRLWPRLGIDFLSSFVTNCRWLILIVETRWLALTFINKYSGI